MTWPPDPAAPPDPHVAAFLDAIADDPDDPAVRLIFADWLAERDDPRADLVRLQAEYRAGDLAAREAAARKVRAWERKHRRRWLGTLPRGGRVELSVVEGRLELAGHGAEAAFGGAPLAGVRHAVREGWFESCQVTVWGEGPFVAAAEAGLFRGPHTLIVLGGALTDAALAALGELPRLRRLSLGGAPLAVTDAGLARLAGYPALRWLGLWTLDQVAGRFLARLGGLDRLAHLSLYNCPAVEEAAVAALPPLPALRSLTVSECPRVGGVAVAVAARYPALESLDLSGNDRLRNADLAPLAGLAALRKLDLAGCRNLGDAALPRLARLAGLEELSLDDWSGLTGGGIARLHGLGNLKRLGLRGVRLPAHEVRALRRALPRCEVLRQ